MKINYIEKPVRDLVEHMASACGTTRREALRALYEVGEVIIADGVARFIRPTKPDGRIAG